MAFDNKAQWSRVLKIIMPHNHAITAQYPKNQLILEHCRTVPQF